ncbi:MAG: MBL fold metallo-hydrolase [Spirochaetales bacterium]|nr:MBL fold metallo-hydrolase [Spirochaetales bacterium]
MSVRIIWLGHASFKISGTKTIYIDPWKIEGRENDGDILLISHSHHDHYSPGDIAKVDNESSVLLGSRDVIQENGYGTAMAAGETYNDDTASVQAVSAYNTIKPFHRKKNQWLGFLIHMDGKTIYYAGDTDVIPEMKDLPSMDAALLPIGGVYTMNAEKAAQASELLSTEIIIPYHWGDIVGTIKDAEKFKKHDPKRIRILSPGEHIDL